MIVVLTAFILTYLSISNKRESQFARWKIIADSLVRQAIFFEPDECNPEEVFRIVVAERIKKLLLNKYFRELLTNAILSAKESISGSSGTYLKSLYLQLGLDKYAVKLIRSKSWYKIASGIKEAGLMDLHDLAPLVSRFVDYKKALVRIEAQNTMIKFDGFKGLDFLDIASYPITEWQQIKLLEQISNLPPDSAVKISGWLKSENESVIIFALKLARTFYQFDLHDQIAECLAHPNPNVRREAISSLKEIESENTASILSGMYAGENLKNKLCILEALKKVGTENEFGFLNELLKDTDPDIQLRAAQSLAAIQPNGLAELNSRAYGENEVLEQIIRYVKSEYI